MQFDEIMDELLEHDDHCNVSVSFYKYQNHYSPEITIKAYHEGVAQPFFVRRYFVEEDRSSCFFYDYLTEHISPFIQNLPKDQYVITEPKGNVITADNIYDATEQTWNFSILRISQSMMA